METFGHASAGCFAKPAAERVGLRFENMVSISAYLLVFN